MGSIVRESLGALTCLPGDELVETWQALTRVVADRALASGSALTSDADDGVTLDDQCATLAATRRDLERATEAARKVTRLAQTVVDLTAYAHHDTVRAQDHLEFERFARADESYSLAPGEFAPAHLAAVLGMQPGTVAAMSDDVAARRSRHPRLLEQLHTVTRACLGCAPSCTRCSTSSPRSRPASRPT